MRSIDPSPQIRVLVKCGRFTIEKKDDFFLLSFLRASSGMNNFNLVKETNHVPGRFFPFSQATGVRANCKALHREGHEEVL